jgi:Ca2+-binding EF-hand superfamily protein
MKDNFTPTTRSLASARRVFMKYDVDKSGEIDQAEFKAMAFDFGMVRPPPEPPSAFGV